MGYCTIDDIAGDFKGIVFSDDAAISEERLQDLIDQESAYIDGRIGVKYLSPIVEATYPTAFELLRRIAIFRVSDRVRSIIEIKTGETQKSSDEKQKDNRTRTPEDDLSLIVKGLLILKDVPLLSKNGAVESFNVDVCQEAVFDVTAQQW